MWARSLFRQVGVLGSVYRPSRDCNLLLRKKCHSRWVPAPRPAYSTSADAVRDTPHENEVVRLNSGEDPAPYTLTKEQEVAITKNDPDRDAKLCKLMLNLYIRKEKGRKLPEILRLIDFESMLGLGHFQLTRFIRHLHKRSYLQKKLIHTKEEKSIALEMKRKYRDQAFSEMEHPWLHYALFCNSLFPRIYQRNVVVYTDCYTGTAIHEGQKVVFDCSYDSEMDEERIKATARQILISLTVNRSDRRPFSLHLCNVNRDSRLMNYLRRMHPHIETDAPITLHSGSYLDVFDRKNLVYLSPHAKVTLKYDPNDIYIIGAMVDKVHGVPLSSKKAAKDEIRCAALPLDQYFKWKTGPKILCLNQITEILMIVKNTGSWAKALKVGVPQRKVWGEPEKDKITKFQRRF